MSRPAEADVNRYSTHDAAVCPHNSPPPCQSWNTLRFSSSPFLPFSSVLAHAARQSPQIHLFTARSAVASQPRLTFPGKRKKKLKPSLHLCEPAVRTHKAPLPSPQLPPQTPMVCLTRASCWFCESSARRSKMVAPLSIGERRQPSSLSCKQKFDQMEMRKPKQEWKTAFGCAGFSLVFVVVFLFFYRTVRIGIFFWFDLKKDFFSLHFFPSFQFFPPHYFWTHCIILLNLTLVNKLNKGFYV